MCMRYYVILSDDQSSLNYLYDTPQYVTEVFCLVGNVEWVKYNLPLNERLIKLYRDLLWREFTTCFITKATSIGNIDGNCLNK